MEIYTFRSGSPVASSTLAEARERAYAGAKALTMAHALDGHSDQLRDEQLDLAETELRAALELLALARMPEPPPVPPTAVCALPTIFSVACDIAQPREVA